MSDPENKPIHGQGRVAERWVQETDFSWSHLQYLTTCPLVSLKPSHHGEMLSRRLRGQVEGWKSHQVCQDQLTHLPSKRSALRKCRKSYPMFIGNMMIHLHLGVPILRVGTCYPRGFQFYILSEGDTLHPRSDSALRDRLDVSEHLLQVLR